MKKENAKEIFSPVIKMFDRNQIQTQYKDDCWSIDLIDRSSLSIYNKNCTFIFTTIDLTILNMHERFLLKINQEKVQQLHSGVSLRQK